MRHSPPDRFAEYREAGDASVVAYIGWRRTARRDAYRTRLPPNVVDPAPASEPNLTATGPEKHNAKRILRLRKHLCDVVRPS
jgi:hypothetical protein